MFVCMYVAERSVTVHECPMSTLIYVRDVPDTDHHHHQGRLDQLPHQCSYRFLGASTSTDGRPLQQCFNSTGLPPDYCAKQGTSGSI